jgi:hypothetical protein
MRPVLLVEVSARGLFRGAATAVFWLGLVLYVVYAKAGPGWLAVTVVAVAMLGWVAAWLLRRCLR